MANETGMSLVLRDTQGRYYEFSEGAVESARVSAERQQELEERLGDVQGFAVSTGGSSLSTLKGTDLGGVLQGAITPTGPVLQTGGQSGQTIRL